MKQLAVGGRFVAPVWDKPNNSDRQHVWTYDKVSQESESSSVAGAGMGSSGNFFGIFGSNSSHGKIKQKFLGGGFAPIDFVFFPPTLYIFKGGWGQPVISRIPCTTRDWGP
mgnify:CR=1 FL=1